MVITAPPPAATPPDARRRAVILAICCASIFVAGIDLTIVNVALPSIGRDLGASLSGMQWAVDAYTLVIASLLLLSGSLADRFGRRRVFQVGLALFSAGSLLCSVSGSLGQLIAFRGLQAVGGSMLNPVAMSIIASVFTEPRERARAVGAWGSVAGLSLATGPVIGGVLVSTIGWRSIFWINVPIGVAAIALTHRLVPESRAPRPRRFDPVGQLLIITTLGPLTGAVIEGSRLGWASPAIIGLLALAAASLGGLILAESRRREPLIDLRFFRSAPFSGATLIAVVAFLASGGFLFINTLYLQDVRGDSALRAGLVSIPMAATMGVCAILSGRLVASRGPRLALCLAGPLTAAGAGMLIAESAHTSLWWLVVAYVLFGAGAGLVTAPITHTALSGMPGDQAGVAGAIASTGRQTGSAIGVAVCGSLAAGPFAIDHAGWAVLCACGATTLVLGLASTGRRALASADRNRQLLLAGR